MYSRTIKKGVFSHAENQKYESHEVFGGSKRLAVYSKDLGHVWKMSLSDVCSFLKYV